MIERINQKIARINEYISLINSIKDKCLTKFQSDPIYRGALLHYLFLMTDSCLSLAEIIIKHKKLRTPQSYSDAIDILGENKIIDQDFAYDFAKIAGFRNFLAHDYEKIDPEIICSGLIPGIEDVETFIEQVRNSLGLN